MQAQNEVKHPPKWKPNNKFNVNADLFMIPTDPRVIYTLGLLWADGTLNVSGVAIREVGLKSTNPDAREFYKIMSSYGKWNRYEYKTKWKPSVQIKTNNKPLVNFLLDMGYGSKSLVSADRILEKIPSYLHHYWFRGLLDGDGCIYVRKHIVQVAFSAPYEQDWFYLKTQLDQLGVTYGISQTITPRGHKSSMLRLTGKTNCLKFLSYLYRNEDGIYLKRKYKKYLNLVNS